MFRGRILVVSDRSEVIAELSPIIRSEGHLALAVSSGEEAMNVFEEGIIPDVVISDLGSSAALEGIAYMKQFRALNQMGQHLLVVEEGGPMGAAAIPPSVAGPSTQLTHPFSEATVRGSLQEAMDRIRRDLASLRGEMFRETARLQRAIRDAQLEMVTALALTMEAKDPYMHGHCDRVATLAQRIAGEMGLDEEEIDRVGTAATLHEIGKLGISLDLLHRKGPLSEGELEEVRRHAQTGAQIIGSVHSLRDLAPLIANQYIDFAELPERIPSDAPEFVLCSILRVADTYDALTSNRSYRRHLSRERWEAILREGSGTRFHPEAIAAFFRVEAALQGV
jgi:response regulator RpfG family c-di-GMP phosphodiesterase